MKKLLTIALTLFAFNANAKEVGLVCDGKVSLFPEKIIDLELSGRVFSVTDKLVVLKNSIPGLSVESGETVFNVTRMDDVTIAFVFSPNIRVTGGINRFTGEITMASKSDTNENQLTRIFKGTCRQSNRLF